MAKANTRTQDCQATLDIAGQSYEGSTGKGNGHAEMDALDYYIGSDPGNKKTITGSIKYCATQLGDKKVLKSVSCPTRPCCLKCSTVLKALGFSESAHTTFSTTPMGSTEWGASLNVRSLLEQCGINYEDVLALK